MTLSKNVRVVVIGAGAMANRVHLPSLSSFDDVDIVGVCDLDQDRLATTAATFGISHTFTNYQQMITSTAPDAVYAIGQPHLMYDVWMWCLEQGHNLYIEKPLGLTLHQARSLAHIAEQRGCTTQVSFQRRTTPVAAKLRDECLKRGPIVHGVCRFYKCEIKPFLSARDHMMDDGVHAIDTLRWICGGDVLRIESVTKRIQTPDINFISAVLHFDTGATGFLINSWSSGRRIFAAEMHAPGICAEVEHERGGTLYADGNTEGIYFDARTVAGGDNLFVFGGFQAKHREFIDCLKAGTQPESNFADAVKTMEVAERILAQALLHS
ncbi:MAG: Gfo/Idh/MocA family oxidoreductase [Herpetosiphon sp.]